ncbi:hypothetical protein ACS5PK_22255 [Roseateles sp. DB2]
MVLLTDQLPAKVLKTKREDLREGGALWIAQNKTKAQTLHQADGRACRPD